MACPEFRNAAVVGCGSIGASWAVLFSAYGISTRVYDPNPAAEIFLQTIVNEAVDALQQLGHFKQSLCCGTNLNDTLSRITFTTDLPTALKNANVVQENGPEDIKIKSGILAMLDDLLEPSVLILTSTSGLTCTSMQSALTKQPQRFAVGHPFNPPHLIPLVEIVGGALTSLQTLKQAEYFYTLLGRKPIILNREISGHIANRLQSALMQEIIYIISEDIATVQDIEKVMEFGPGLRWGVMGPSLLMHLGGGPGGVAYYAEKLLGPLLSWNSGQAKVLDSVSREKWVKQTLAVVGDQSYVELSRRRDAGIINSLTWRSKWEKIQSPQNT